VYEYDAPPTAWIEFTGAEGVLRFVHHVATAKGFTTQAQARESMAEFESRLCEQLRVTANECGAVAFIFWRTRPAVERHGKSWGWYMRLATSPPLSDSFWDAVLEAVDGRPTP
jgi:hypothetical protein